MPDEWILIDGHRGLRGLHDGCSRLFRTVIHIRCRLGDLRVHEEEIPGTLFINMRLDDLIDLFLIRSSGYIRCLKVQRLPLLRIRIALCRTDGIPQQFEVASRRRDICFSLGQCLLIAVRLCLVLLGSLGEGREGLCEGAKILDVLAVNVLEWVHPLRPVRRDLQKFLL